MTIFVKQTLNIIVMGIFSSIVGGLFGLAGQSWQGEYNRKLYEQQYRDSVAMYERQLADSKQATAEERAYNSPAAQSARLKAAGKNPDLADINNFETSSASTPSMNIPQQQGMDIAGNMTQIGSMFSSVMEGVMSFMSQIEDFKQKKIETQAQYDSMVDELINSVFSPDEVENLSRSFPNWSKGDALDKYLKGLYRRHGRKNVLDPAVKTASPSWAPAMAKLKAAVDSSGYTRTQKKRIMGASIRRIQSITRKAGFKSTQAGMASDNLDILDSGIKTGKSWYEDVDKEVNSMLKDMIEAQVKAEKHNARLSEYNANQAERQDKQSSALDPFADLIEEWSNSDSPWKVVGAMILMSLKTMISGSGVTFSPGKSGGFGGSIGF